MSYKKRDLIDYWIEKSYKAKEIANFNIEKDYYDFAVSDLYYSVFYMVTAYLTLKEISFKKHSAVRSFFHRELIKKGIINLNFSKIYDELYFSREEADYSPFPKFYKEEIKFLYDQTENLLKELEKIIKKEMENNDYT